MRQFLMSSMGLGLMIAGFILIASLSSSLSPQAVSQTPPPPQDFDPSSMNIPENVPMPEGASPADGGESPLPSMDSEPILDQMAAPQDLSTSPVTGESMPLRQDPFIPMISPARPQSNVQIVSGAEVPADLGPESDEFFDPNDPLRAHYLREYKLSGVLWSTSNPKAMFATPDGRTLTLKRKSFLGREGAVVLTVRESEVIFLLPGPGRNYENGTVKILSMRK